MFTADERIRFCDAYVKKDEKPIDLDRRQELYIADTSPFSITLKGRRKVSVSQRH